MSDKERDLLAIALWCTRRMRNKPEANFALLKLLELEEKDTASYRRIRSVIGELNK